jgi:hypothetical protein
MNNIKNIVSESIKKGDTIGLIAPSSPLPSGLLESSIAYF